MRENGMNDVECLLSLFSYALVSKTCVFRRVISSLLYSQLLLNALVSLSHQHLPLTCNHLTVSVIEETTYDYYFPVNKLECQNGKKRRRENERQVVALSFSTDSGTRHVPAKNIQRETRKKIEMKE